MINQLNQIAKDRRGKCLSNIYKGSKSKLLWECKKSHQWEATPSSIKQGTWCPFCARTVKSLNIAAMQSLAAERGGNCLSNAYRGINKKHLWECSEGHQWETSPSHVKRGTWCPYCAKRVKRTIEEMHQIAKERGGKCLSDTYINNATKLLWECSEGHKWQAVPLMIFRGFWCMRCKSILLSTLREQKKRFPK